MIGCRAYYMAQAGKFGDLTLNAKPSVEIGLCILERGLIVDIGQDILNTTPLGPLQTLIT